MNLNYKLLAVLVLSCMVAGCKSRAPRTDTDSNSSAATSADSGADSSVQTQGVTTVSASEGGTGQGALGPDGDLGSQRVIYFGYDSSEIGGEYAAVVAAHGRFLSSNPGVRVRLEGHTDERGSREYNIGLAERRAQTVRRALALQGVQPSQLTTVSYGEERPAAAGSDENAWSKNRRVELVYIN